MWRRERDHLVALPLLSGSNTADEFGQPNPRFTGKGTPMKTFTKALVNFVKKEDGPTAVEYAVMLALIVVVCIAAITTLGSNANSTFSFVGSSIQPPAAS
jgi:pilus assembly protein Flp/PilA